MKLTLATQESLLALLCYDDLHARIVSSIVPPKTFDVFYRDIAMAAFDYLQRYNKAPKTHTLDLVEAIKAQSPDKAKALDKIYLSLQQIKKATISSPDFIIKQASIFSRFQHRRGMLESAWSAIEKDNEAGLLEAEGLILKGMKDRQELMDVGTIFTDVSKSLRFLDDEWEAIPTGVKVFDKAGIGNVRGRLLMVAGGAKKGKSWFLLQMAKWAILFGYRVLYVSGELSEPELCRRGFQCFFSMTKREERGLSRMKFVRDELGRFTEMAPKAIPKRPWLQSPNITKRLIKLLSRLQNRPPLCFKKFPMGGFTVDDVDASIDALEAVHGWTPDLVIVDYAGTMKLDIKNYRHSAIETMKHLKGLADRRNVAVATAWQLNRDAVKKGSADETYLAEAWEIAAQIDLGFFLSRTDDEEQLGLARLRTLDRNDAGGTTVLIAQNYSIGQFPMDSVKMTSNYWSMLEKRTGEEDEEVEEED